MQSIETQRTGYLSLLEISLGNAQQDNIKLFIGSLPDYTGDNNYMTTLNFVLRHLNEEGICWIIALDWKADIADLASRLARSLVDNYGVTADLPTALYGEGASVSKPLVFVEYDQALRTVGFQLGFIDTQSDEYILFIHRVEDAKPAREAVEKIGYPYMDKDSANVRNEW